MYVFYFINCSTVFKLFIFLKSNYTKIAVRNLITVKCRSLFIITIYTKLNF